MDKTREIINKYKEDYPEFEYYFGHLDVIEENLERVPDISIETCKGLIDGISKTILDCFSVDYVEQARNADGSDQLNKKALSELAKHIEIDDPIIQNTTGIIKRISDIRNERADIAHGKSVLRKIKSDKETAKLITGITDSHIAYLLALFFSLKLPLDPSLKYEDNPLFNEFLDSDYDLNGVVYSKALFDQDIISYKEQLKDYLSAEE